MDTLGSRIKEIRNRLKLTQKEMATLLGLKTRQSIFEYENDKNEPNVEILTQISKLGDVSLDWLLKGDFNYKYIESEKSCSFISETKHTMANERSVSLLLTSDEVKIIEFIRQHPEALPIIVELIESKVKQIELIKKLGDL